jgi:hypothetical protein
MINLNTSSQFLEGFSASDLVCYIVLEMEHRACEASALPLSYNLDPSTTNLICISKILRLLNYSRLPKLTSQTDLDREGSIYLHNLKEAIIYKCKERRTLENTNISQTMSKKLFKNLFQT